MANIKYVMFKMHRSNKSINGTYFVQQTGNENAIDKFQLINAYNYEIDFYYEEYTQEQIDQLISTIKIFNDLMNTCPRNRREMVILKGRLSIPGDNKAYNDEELNKWWYENLDDVDWPHWQNIAEEVIDLLNYNM